MLQAGYSSRKQTGINDPGKLDRCVLIQAFVVNQDALGAATRTWVNLAQAWASRRPAAQRRFFAQEGKHVEAEMIFRIRHRSDISPLMRLVHGDDTYEIIGTEEMGRGHMLDLECRLVDQTPGSPSSVAPAFQTDASGNVFNDENGIALRSN